MRWLTKLLRKRSISITTGFVLLIALIWIVGWWWLGMPVLGCVVATVIVLLIWVIALLVERLTAQRSGAMIERSIKEQSEEQVLGVRPEKREELETLRQQLTTAIDALKRSKLAKGRRGSAALYALPWYMIIGPPAA